MLSRNHTTPTVVATVILSYVSVHRLGVLSLKAEPMMFLDKSLRSSSLSVLVEGMLMPAGQQTCFSVCSCLLSFNHASSSSSFSVFLPHASLHTAHHFSKCIKCLEVTVWFGPKTKVEIKNKEEMSSKPPQKTHLKLFKVQE